LSNDDITYRDRLLQFAREQGLDWNYGIQDPYDRNRRLVPEKIYLQSMVCDVEHESSDDHPLPKARMDKYDRITRNFKLAFPDCEVLEGNEYGPGWQEFQLRCERAAGGKVLTKPRDVFEYGCII
jgi:hypothetical protein